LQPGWLADESATRDLLRLVACSEFAGSAVIRDWEWFADAALGGRLAQPPRTAVRHVRFEDGDDAVKRQLRKFRHRKLLHILWRDLAGAATVAETLSSLSALADSMISAATRFAETDLASRFGKPRDKDGKEMQIVVL